MRARHLGYAAVTGTAILALLTGCDQDDPGPPDPTESPSSPTPTEPSDSTSSPTDPTSSATPTTGVLLRGSGVSVRAPEGWERADPIVDFLETANDPSSTNSLGLASSDAIGAPSLAAQAASAIEVGGWVQDPEILAPVTIGGVRMFHLAGQIDPATNVELVGTVHEGHQVEVTLFFERGTTTAAQQRQITESVWASVAWD